MNEGKIKCAIFPSNAPRDLVLSKNGICLDSFCIKSKGYVNLAGNFRLEATCSNTKVVKETLKQGCILKVCDEYGNDEIFRITNISNNTKMVVTIIAFQITITDTKTLWLKDVRPTDCSGLSALQKIYNESEANGFRKELFINSDIKNKSTAYFQDMNLYDAIHTCDQSFTNRWGGEILRNKYTLTINERIGQDNGVTIREGKNLLGFKSKTDLSSVVTVAIGKGYDGIKGDYIESPYKSKYPGANTKVIEYSDVKVRTESDNSSEGFATLKEAKAELNRRVKEEFSKNHIDELKATYEIDFLDLSKTEEYKDYVQAERVDIGDIVRVVVDSLDLTLTTRVIEKEIDYLSGRVTKITLSNNPVAVTKSDAEIISGIRNLLIKNNNSDLSNYIDAMMKSGIKDSYVVNRLNETLWMDNQDINLAKNVVKVNKNGLFFS
ncbi:MAG: phage tail spike protein, partial [Clostridium sp.]|uniref:phage tail spike protein n=1 Tax=Clostridium sp. TaxID=1506 RepID=UPI003F310886